jgi:hypothetical protein
MLGSRLGMFVFEGTWHDVEIEIEIPFLWQRD